MIPARLRLALICLLTFALFLLPSALASACGLDWTLPQAHFEGVDEQGYVAYWEKIGQADLGDGLLIPVNIGFNSHRQSASPTLGQGWILPLLESHVEPVDENTMHVIMPDGWIFTFLRNGSTNTWRGNAGWAGQTDGARFTITAPCGWRVKFDTGKIQEIDTPKNRTITIKYNGTAPLEADIDNKPFVQVEQNTATGVAQSITIAGQKILISQAQRPRIQSVMGKTLLTGFDPALSTLQYPNGQKETFDFSAPASLTPTLVVTHSGQPPRNLTWDPTTYQIKTDGQWTYHLVPADNVKLERSNLNGRTEYYLQDPSTGITTIQGLDGVRLVTTFFVNAGVLTGKIREVTRIKNGVATVLRRCDYDEKGKLVREFFQTARTHELDFKYNASGKAMEIDIDSKIYTTMQYDPQGRIISRTLYGGARQTFTYVGTRIQEITSFDDGRTRIRNLNIMFQPIQDFADNPDAKSQK